MNPHVGGFAELARGLVLAKLVRVGGSLNNEQDHEQGQPKGKRAAPILPHVVSSSHSATY
jgi:hypothetical protein